VAAAVAAAVGAAVGAVVGTGVAELEHADATSAATESRTDILRTVVINPSSWEMDLDLP
jgi:hypothetical protein